MSRVYKVKEQLDSDKEQGKYSIELKTEEDREKYFKEILQENAIEKRNLGKSWDLFIENVLSDDFKWSRRSGLAMVFFPALTNAYFIWGAPGHYLKNPVRIAALITGIVTFNYNLNKDFEELAKKDTPLANKFRSYAQNIAKVNLNYPDFVEETVRIAVQKEPQSRLEMTLRKRVFDKLHRLSYNHLEENFDDFAYTLRFPNNPKISLYGATNSLFQNLLAKTFEDYLRIDSTTILDSKEAKEKPADVIESVARAITRVRPDFSDKYVVVNFPQSPEQAEKLDDLIDGINLAVNLHIAPEAVAQITKSYFECKVCGLKFNTEVNSALPPFPGATDACSTPKLCNIIESQPVHADKITDYEKKYKPVLDYYNKRGILLNFSVDPSWTLEEAAQNLIDAIGGQIKH